MGLLDDCGDDTPPRSPLLNVRVPDIEEVHIISSDEDDEDDELVEVEDVDELIETMEGDESIKETPPFVNFSAHSDEVLCGDFHPSQKNIVATSGVDEKLYVWRYSSALSVVLMEVSFLESVDCVKFSPNGEFLAAADLTGNLRVFETNNWKSHLFHDLEDQLEGLLWHPSFPVIVAVLKTQVVMMNVLRKEAKPVAWRTTGFFVRGKFFPDGKRIALVNDHGVISTIDLKTASVVSSATAKIQDEVCAIACLDVHRDGAVVLCGCTEGQIFSFATESSKITFYPAGLGGSESVEDISYCKAEGFKNLAASIHLNGVICFWDTSKQTLRCQCVTGTCGTQMVWHHSEPILFTAHTSGVALMIDGRTGNLLKELQCHQAAIMGFALSSDSSRLLTCSEDRFARVFELSYENDDGESMEMQS